MGQCCSGKQAVGAKREEPTRLELRIQKALQFIVEQRQQASLKRQNSAASGVGGAKAGPSDARLDRVILKFPTIRAAFSSIRSVFALFDADKNGVIDHEELKACMEGLGASLEESEINDMFTGMKMTQGNPDGLNFREFLLALSIGSVLQLFPLMKAYTSHELPASDSHSLPAASARSSGSMTEGSALHLRGQKLVKALQHVLEAYVLFDADASGTIDREEVLNIIREKGARKGGASGLLSKERWAELDWDDDGQITFVEFLYAFEAWVGVDEDSDEDGEDHSPLTLPGVDTSAPGGAAAPAQLPLDAVSLTTTPTASRGGSSANMALAPGAAAAGERAAAAAAAARAEQDAAAAS